MALVVPTLPFHFSFMLAQTAEFLCAGDRAFLCPLIDFMNYSPHGQYLHIYEFESLDPDLTRESLKLK